MVAHEGSEVPNYRRNMKSLRANNLIRKWSLRKKSENQFCTAIERQDFETKNNIPKTPRRGHSDTLTQRHLTKEVRITVGTWNVAGKPPPPDLNIDEWLCLKEPADVYVLGFQEIIPLNAGYVLGIEDYAPAAVKWESLIYQSLNKANQVNWKRYSAPPSPCREETSEILDPIWDESDTDVEDEIVRIEYQPEARFEYHSPPYQGKDIARTDRNRITGTSVCAPDHPLSTSYIQFKNKSQKQAYVRVASKQMVGIHISVWTKKRLRPYIHNLTVSCVGVGFMGYLGNKGSVAVSMLLNETSFCFICTHLTSGENEGDEIRRNADVLEILKRTHFSSSKSSGMSIPKSILGHDRIIWFGDLNYRLSLSHEDARSLVAREEWETLLHKDELRNQLCKGHIFEGWNEGPIYFAPTYKYEMDSEYYVGEKAKGDKRRPAWCDRILWFGRGLRIISYTRVESNLSDHRPVNGVFVADIDVIKFGRELVKLVSPKVGTHELLLH